VPAEWEGCPYYDDGIKYTQKDDTAVSLTKTKLITNWHEIHNRELILPRSYSYSIKNQKLSFTY